MEVFFKFIFVFFVVCELGVGGFGLINIVFINVFVNFWFVKIEYFEFFCMLL